VPQAIGVLLAGGQSRRMGGGLKCLKELGGRTLIRHVIERAAPQVSELIVSVNGDHGPFEDLGLPLIDDVIEGYAGPLAGILSAMEWAAAKRRDCDWLVSLPTDSPFLPSDLVARMFEAMDADSAELACAASNGRTHPICGLWPVPLAGDLRAAMENEDMRKIDAWTARYKLAVVEFSADPVDPFFNINRPEDLEEGERILANA
jgi:molybdopterin-guanine dinucleotide biosynthesis protein A